MTQTQGNLASLSRFIFRAPNWYSSLGFALCIAALTGIAAFDSRFVLDDAWQGVFFIGLPTAIAGAVTPWVDRQLGGQLTPNRASLLALICELITIAFLTAAGVIALLSARLGANFVFDVLLVALASIFAFRLLILMGVSRHGLLKAAVPASVQTVAAAALLAVYSGATAFILDDPQLRDLLARTEQAPPALQGFIPADFVILAVICVFYAFAVWLFLVLIDQPWRSSLGVSALDFLRGFIGYLAEGSDELEEFFEDIGEEAIVPVTVLAVRRPDGEEKARFVLPMIHPGPMGEIGGGNLPKRVAESADGLAFPPHATAGHDFNLVTEREVDTILKAAEAAYEDITYDDTATAGHRITEGEATLTGQAFGDDAFIVATYAPGCADDVDYAVGLSAMAEARNGEFDDVLLVDAHNSNDGLEGEDLGHVVPGSKRSFDMIHGSGELSRLLNDAEAGRLRCGVAWEETPWEPQQGIGPLGIRACVFEVDGHRTAYVLVDGNNMEPGLRGRIVEAVEGVDSLEVMTSDTHIVNTVEAENQVGQAIPEAEVIDRIERLVGEAIEDLEPVEAGMASEQAEVTVFGNDRTETLASTANAMVSLGGGLAAAFIIAVMLVSVLIFLVAGV
jgi:putative membrane protein